MKRIRLQSPAKLNLFLKVINKRSDGYHNLKTLFERINLCDTIDLELNRSGAIRIACRHPHVPKGPKNLVYRVAALLRQDFQVPFGVNIRIQKRIPVAAGLAGGSSNAATVLCGLNKLWKLNLSQKQLLNYGARIGSDVSFFLYDCSWAIGTRRGEQIKRLNIRRKLWHVLVVPYVKMYTKEVFGRLNLKLTKQIDNVNILTRSLQKGDLSKVGRLLFNDLESSILQIRPSLFAVKDRLASFPLKGVSFSGSGPSVFGIATSQHQAQHIESLLRHRYKQIFVVRTL
jgi:4-diphosphocytidyl-2-C-methyl-D-erythritol kinase